MNNTKLSTIMIVLVFSLLAATFAQADKLYRERVYEPVVLKGSVLKSFYNVPVNEIYMYAYDEATQAWRMMPFQIDERTFGPVPETNRKRWYYFIPPEWATIDSINISNHDGILTDHDELAFMIRDLGDQAPDYVWIDNAEAKGNTRLEIEIADPNDANKKAYGYLFRSTTITDAVPKPYEFSFDSTNQVVDTKNYSLRLSWDNGLINDIIIKPPLGSGVDIFDTQKIRANGLFNFGFGTLPIGLNGNPSANERDNLYLYPDFHFTKDPVIRIVREANEALRIADIIIDQAAFPVVTKFYPFNGTLEGGAKLDSASLKNTFGKDTDVLVLLDLIRQSWDFNANAIGMKFFNKYNDGIVIDGVPDVVNKTVDTPIKEWMMTTGKQGTLFSYVTFKDVSWQDIKLYYYDNNEGGQGDDTTIPGGDTGDSLSFGDQGILFQSPPVDKDSISLELGFIAYFVEKNKDKSFAEQLAYYAGNPVQAKPTAISFPTSVKEKAEIGVLENYELYQNYPNPFNNSTLIRFNLPQRSKVSIRIIDVNGRTVATLVNGMMSKGSHQIHWSGLTNQNAEVPSGIYFYEMRTKNYSAMKKLILVR
ncbi:MAG: T9SS type A sorting domain-containing protein [Actinobacteria bacterium]|nr:T9SS type A sorting domain-containing protein [Actinomycetota bacterium]